LDGTVVWGKSYTFKAPPIPGQNSLQRVIIFGDMGKVQSSVYILRVTGETHRTVDMLITPSD
jgi:hypothetical protein